jgi:hypothetical protein
MGKLATGSFLSLGAERRRDPWWLAESMGKEGASRAPSLAESKCPVSQGVLRHMAAGLEAEARGGLRCARAPEVTAGHGRTQLLQSAHRASGTLKHVPQTRLPWPQHCDRVDNPPQSASERQGTSQNVHFSGLLGTGPGQ